LIWQTWEGGQIDRYEWLRGTPLQWEAHPTQDQISLIWRTSDNRLWLALLTPQGEQLTAPVELGGEGGVEDFRAWPLANGQTLVLWLEGGSLWQRRADAAARPLIAEKWRGGVGKLALAGPDWAVWQEAGRIYAAPIGDGLGEAIHLGMLNLGPDEWLANLQALSLEDHLIALWGISSAQAPDLERYAGAILPPNSPPIPFTLDIPGTEGLRWAGVYGNQVSLAALMDGRWQAVQVGFGPGGPQGYQIIPGSEVTGGPVILSAGAAAWITLDPQGRPEWVLQSLDPAYGRLVYAPPPRPSLRESFLAALPDSPLLAAWGLLAASLFIWGPLAETRVLLIYALGKLLIGPLDFAHFPASLAALGWEGEPFWPALGLLIFIQGAALAVAWWEAPPRIRYAAYCLTDALLTCVFLGAALK
jgi:hypothetical protein